MARKATKTMQAALAEYEYAIMELSEGTQVWYMGRLKRFSQWCSQKRLHLDELKPAHISAYLQGLRQPSARTGKPLSTYTLHGHMRSIRAFLYWCAREPQSYLRKTVPENIVMPKIEIKVIQPFSKEQILAMRVAATQNHFPIMVARNKAILAVLLDTGIRAGELCSLTLDHVYITAREGYLKVMGKGKKEREVPLGIKSRRLLHEYLKRFRPALPGEVHVFLGHKHEPLTVNALDQMLYRLGRRAKIKGVRISAHTWRHTFAINFLTQGGDVYVLSRLMGHESVQVTEVYLRAVKATQARKASKSVLDNL
jgi:site-specific recombinase XerD